MSGYQVHNPNFFVALNQGASIDAKVALLQEAYYRSSGEYVYNSASGALTLDAATGVIGQYFSSTGASAFTLTLPSATNIVKVIETWKRTNIGSQVVSIPSGTIKRNADSTSETLREYWSRIQAGFNSRMTIFNGNTANAITLANGVNTILNSATTIAAGDVAFLTFVVTDIDTPIVKVSVLQA